MIFSFHTTSFVSEKARTIQNHFCRVFKNLISTLPTPFYLNTIKVLSCTLEISLEHQSSSKRRQSR